MDRVTYLKQALPFIQQHRLKTFVLTLDETLLEDRAAITLLVEDISLLHNVGVHVVVVHGGERGADLVTALTAGGLQAVGLSGLDGSLFELTGAQTIKVQPQVLTTLISAGFVPVVASLTSSGTGPEPVDVTLVAEHVACAINASKLFFFTDTPGLLADPEDPNSLIPYCDVNVISSLLADYPETPLTQTLKSTIKALDAGVERVHVVSAWQPSALLLEVFTTEGCGTLVVLNTDEAV